jgi:hypothetical protein
LATLAQGLDLPHSEDASLYGHQPRPQVAFFYASLYIRILGPNWAALVAEDDHLPRALRAALDQLDPEIQRLHEEAAVTA